ncbi:hypothetical protein [Engelhardtia mirabilis]|uniref:Uncharacterized protein n=1 Tax=Engelhardtia mirabilis TaxID=2528011 RepID=A0A518BQ27_9BACT|nr:hypothetical protein Pla133_41840 [Planctomycetes bacterium Pla133]QDV03395.1 hypothetical protein Pla86_41830 [Planctomycetes bacterium Pla86]
MDHHHATGDTNSPRRAAARLLACVTLGLPILAGSATSQAGLASAGDRVDGRPSTLQGLDQDNVLAPPAVPAEPVTQLRMRDGRIVWGWILEHDPDALTVQRLDHGGQVVLPWGYLDPRQEGELKDLFGYVDLSDQEVMVTASRIPLRTGEELVGMMTSRSDQYIEVKNANGLLQVPVTNLAGTILQEQVPARQIYTRDELYELEARRYASAILTGGSEAAKAHFELARYCERIFDFRRAHLHYMAIAEVDPTFEHPDLEASLARAARRAEAQEQADMLDEIDRLRARDLYPAAVELLGRFPQLYPDSPLTEDLIDLQKSVLRDRERDMVSEVEDRWHNAVLRVARDKGRETNYEAVLAWMEEGMTQEVVARVTEDLQRFETDVSPERIRELWGERAARRNKRATYGAGTWLLGREGARAGLETTEDDKSTTDPRSEERKKIEDRIQRYLRNQEVASAGGGAEEGKDPQLFWQNWTGASRAQWIVSFYAEQSGDMTVTRATVRPCRECGGVGYHEHANMGGSGSGNNSTRLIECPLCAGVAVTRRVSYR